MFGNMIHAGSRVRVLPGRQFTTCSGGDVGVVLDVDTDAGSCVVLFDCREGPISVSLRHLQLEQEAVQVDVAHELRVTALMNSLQFVGGDVERLTTHLDAQQSRVACFEESVHGASVSLSKLSVELENSERQAADLEQVVSFLQEGLERLSGAIEVEVRRVTDLEHIHCQGSAENQDSDLWQAVRSLQDRVSRETQQREASIQSITGTFVQSVEQLRHELRDTSRNPDCGTVHLRNSMVSSESLRKLEALEARFRDARTTMIVPAHGVEVRRDCEGHLEPAGFNDARLEGYPPSPDCVEVEVESSLTSSGGKSGTSSSDCLVSTVPLRVEARCLAGHLSGRLPSKACATVPVEISWKEPGSLGKWVDQAERSTWDMHAVRVETRTHHC